MDPQHCSQHKLKIQFGHFMLRWWYTAAAGLLPVLHQQGHAILVPRGQRGVPPPGDGPLRRLPLQELAQRSADAL
jgi:hypothetical protein